MVDEEEMDTGKVKKAMKEKWNYSRRKEINRRGGNCWGKTNKIEIYEKRRSKKKKKKLRKKIQMNVKKEEDEKR